MKALLKRVARLELEAGSLDEIPKLIILSVQGARDEDIKGLRLMGDERLERLPGESLQALEARAAEHLHRQGGPSLRVLLYDIDL